MTRRQPTWVKIAREELEFYTWQAEAWPTKDPRRALAIVRRDRVSKLLVDWANQ